MQFTKQGQEAFFDRRLAGISPGGQTLIQSAELIEPVVTWAVSSDPKGELPVLESSQFEQSFPRLSQRLDVDKSEFERRSEALATNGPQAVLEEATRHSFLFPQLLEVENTPLALVVTMFKDDYYAIVSKRSKAPNVAYGVFWAGEDWDEPYRNRLALLIDYGIFSAGQDLRRTRNHELYHALFDRIHPHGLEPAMVAWDEVVAHAATGNFVPERSSLRLGPASQPMDARNEHLWHDAVEYLGLARRLYDAVSSGCMTHSFVTAALLLTPLHERAMLDELAGVSC